MLLCIIVWSLLYLPFEKNPFFRKNFEAHSYGGSINEEFSYFNTLHFKELQIKSTFLYEVVKSGMGMEKDRYEVEENL